MGVSGNPSQFTYISGRTLTVSHFEGDDRGRHTGGLTFVLPDGLISDYWLDLSFCQEYTECGNEKY